MSYFSLSSHSSVSRFKTILLSAVLFSTVGCFDSGGGGDDNSGTGGDGGGGGSTPTPTDTSTTPTVSFNLSGAVSLVANEEAIVEDTSRSISSKTGKPIFSYTLAKNAKTPLARSINGREDEEEGVSNLLAIDEEGDASLAIDTNMPMKVMYSVVSPDGSKVYIALDTGWHDNSSSEFDYASTIAALNCGLLEVDTDTDEHRCVEEGLMVQYMDDSYMQNVSGNQKPIQFDTDGNVYFTATSFTRQEDSFCNEFDNDGNCISEQSNFWLNQVDWNPLIYKMSASDQSVTNISQDNEHVQFFLTLSSGEVAYQAWQDTNSGNLVLKVVNSAGSVVNLSSDSWVKFFTKDSENALVWGEEDWSNASSGLKMAKPIQDDSLGRFQFASLDTSLFGAQDQNNGWSSPTPRRIIMADDGRVYGVFESGSSEYNSTNDTWTWNNSLKVFQMLPFDGVPKVELDLGDDGWWSWMQDTPFQISRGFLYYTEEVVVPGLNEADVIRMVNLETRELTTLIDPNESGATGRYEIYNWRLSGNTLFFSALELGSNTVVTGQIDTLGVRAAADDADLSQFLTLQETATASGAASKVQDIEVIAPSAPPVEAGNFLVQDVHVDPVNIYSVSVDFNKYPDASSVDDNITLTSADTTEGDNGVIPTFKLWLYKTLHMVPDLEQTGSSVDPLLLPETVPMSFDETYTVAFNASSIIDLSGFQLQSASDATLETRPQTGWYNTGLLANVDTAIADDKVLKYATSFDTWEKKGWDILGADIGANFQVDFAAKNFSWDGIDVMLFDKANSEARNADQSNWDNDWASLVFNYRLGGWSNLEYANGSNAQTGWVWYNHTWFDKDTHDTLFNGVWKNYRVKVYGTNIELYYSDDGTTYTQVADLSKTDLVSRAGTDYRLILRAASPLALDNLTLTTLDGSGDVSTSTGDLLDKDFNDGNTPASLATPMTDANPNEWYPSSNDIW
ncbi:hypothetical protein NBRC116188_14280 [Oceaniserpentilla sp. 4NH20-0058]|uniref:hypothetical protein n=1 Tax=Oceaniserpentilla sp. 4NH20-0058 TaxID=3127660 RepID=UPI00310273A6